MWSLENRLPGYALILALTPVLASLAYIPNIDQTLLKFIVGAAGIMVALAVFSAGRASTGPRELVIDKDVALFLGIFALAALSASVAIDMRTAIFGAYAHYQGIISLGLLTAAFVMVKQIRAGGVEAYTRAATLKKGRDVDIPTMVALLDARGNAQSVTVEGFDRAVEAAGEVVERNPKSLEAASQYKHAWSLRKSSFYPAFQAGKSLEQAGDRSGALDTYRSAVKIKSNSPGAREAIERIEEEAGLEKQ